MCFVSFESFGEEKTENHSLYHHRNTVKFRQYLLSLHWSNIRIRFFSITQNESLHNGKRNNILLWFAKLHNIEWIFRCQIFRDRVYHYPVMFNTHQTFFPQLICRILQLLVENMNFMCIFLSPFFSTIVLMTSWNLSDLNNCRKKGLIHIIVKSQHSGGFPKGIYLHNSPHIFFRYLLVLHSFWRTRLFPFFSEKALFKVQSAQNWNLIKWKWDCVCFCAQLIKMEKSCSKTRDCFDIFEATWKSRQFSASKLKNGILFYRTVCLSRTIQEEVGNISGARNVAKISVRTLPFLHARSRVWDKTIFWHRPGLLSVLGSFCTLIARWHGNAFSVQTANV